MESIDKWDCTWFMNLWGQTKKPTVYPNGEQTTNKSDPKPLHTPATLKPLDIGAEKTCGKIVSSLYVYATQQILGGSDCMPPCYE